MKLTLPKLDFLKNLVGRLRKRGKKATAKGDVDDEDFLPSSERDDENDEVPAGPKKDARGKKGDSKLKAEDDDEDDEDEDGDDDDEEDDEAAGKRKRLMVIGGAGAAALVLVGGGLWWFFSAAPGDVATDSQAPVVVADLERLEAETSAMDVATSNGPPPPSAKTPAASSGESDGKLETSLNQLAGDEEVGPDAGRVVVATTKQAFSNIPAPEFRAEPLEPAPDDTLMEETTIGLLPKIAEDGRTSFEVYARPAGNLTGPEPRIAVVVSGLGHSRAATEAAIELLPAEVTLSFDSYARGIGYWIDRARDGGHEVLLTLPLESATFPFEDPGPNALDSLASPETNIEQMGYTLARASGYIGLITTGGSAFVKNEEQMKVMMKVIKDRGLAYIDGGYAPGSLGPKVAHAQKTLWAAVDIELDAFPNRAAIDIKLDEFEDMAKRRAVAVARLSPYPVSLAQVSSWLGKLKEKGLVLVPLSALVNKQLVR